MSESPGTIEQSLVNPTGKATLKDLPLGGGDRTGADARSRTELGTSAELVVDRGNTVPWDRGRGELKGKDPAEITDTVREHFMTGDSVYVVMNDKIGDMVQATALIEGLVAAQEALGVDKKITVISPSKALVGLFQPFMDQHGIEFINEGTRMEGVPYAETHIRQRGEKNSMIIELEHFDGEPVVGKHQPDGPVIVRDVFHHFNAQFDNENAGMDRYARFTENFLGLKRGTIPSETTQPQIDLPSDANERYTRLTRELGIDTNKKQISIVLEASTPGRMYDKYDEVIKLIKTKLGTGVEVNLIYDGKRAQGDQPDQQLQEWQKIAGQYPDGSVRMTAIGLADMPVFLANQDVVFGADSGLSHIAGNVVEGPVVIPIYLPPQTDPKIWEVNMQRMRGICAPTDPLVDHETDGTRCADPKIKRINKIPPESLALKALSLMRSSAERPNSTISRPDAISRIHADLIGRAPSANELAYFVGSSASIAEVAEMVKNSPARTTFELGKLYQEVFGRDIDQSGLATYTAELHEGRSLGSIRRTLLASDEFRNRINQLAQQDRAQAINVLYQSALGRPLDPDGRKTYVDNTSIPITTVIQAVSESDEFRLSYLENSENRHATKIEQLYRELNGGEIDSKQLAEYSRRLAQGDSLTSFGVDMLQSPAVQQRLDGMDRMQAIRLLYKVILGRDIDRSGYQSFSVAPTAWRDAMNTLLESGEYKQKLQ